MQKSEYTPSRMSLVSPKEDSRPGLDRLQKTRPHTRSTSTDHSSLAYEESMTELRIQLLNPVMLRATRKREACDLSAEPESLTSQFPVAFANRVIHSRCIRMRIQSHSDVNFLHFLNHQSPYWHHHTQKGTPYVKRSQCPRIAHSNFRNSTRRSGPETRNYIFNSAHNSQ